LIKYIIIKMCKNDETAAVMFNDRAQ